MFISTPSNNSNLFVNTNSSIFHFSHSFTSDSSNSSNSTRKTSVISPINDNNSNNSGNNARRWQSFDIDEIKEKKQHLHLQIRKDKRYEIFTRRRQRCMDNSNELNINDCMDMRHQDNSNLIVMPSTDNMILNERDLMIQRLPIFQEKQRQIYCNNLDDQIIALEFYRKLLSMDKKPPITLIVRTGIVPRIIELLPSCLLSKDEKLDRISLESVWCITNIACGNDDEISLLLQHNIIPKLLELLMNSTNFSIREQCLWAISNLASETTGKCKDQLLALNIIYPLLWQIGINPPTTYVREEMPSLSTMSYVTWTMCSFCKPSSIATPPVVQTLIIKAFALLLESPDNDIKNDICLALCSLCDSNIENVNLYFELGICRRLLELCASTPTNLTNQKPPTSLFAIRSICSLLQSPFSFNRRMLVSIVLSNRRENCLFFMIRELRICFQVLDTQRGNQSPEVITLYNDTINEILRAIMTLFETDNEYIIHITVTLDCIPLLVQQCILCEYTTFNQKIIAGLCICEIINKMTICMDSYASQLIYLGLKALLQMHDTQILLPVLQSLLKLFENFYSNSKHSSYSLRTTNKWNDKELMERIEYLNINNENSTILQLTSNILGLHENPNDYFNQR